MKTSLLTLLFLLAAFCSMAQEDDLMELLEEEAEESPVYVEQTFKGTRLINGHSIETRDAGVLDFIISHRFGRLNSGGYNFFGLDDSNIRLGLDYGIVDRLNVGIGRSSFEKTFDGFVKYKLVRQRKANTGNVPVSVVGFASVALKTLKDANNEFDFSQGLAYTYQAIIARKFSPAFSFQLSPTIIHRNAVLETADPNVVYALGAGGRIKLTTRISFNAEYYHQFNRPDASVMHDAVAIGFDIETGGHVFQLHFTNARAMIEKGFITQTDGDFLDGDIHFGFNISRTFQLSGEKEESSTND